MSSQEPDEERLNFDEVDALNNDFDRDSASTTTATTGSHKAYMSTAERMDKLINDIGGFGRF